MTKGVPNATQIGGGRRFRAANAARMFVILVLLPLFSMATSADHVIMLERAEFAPGKDFGATADSYWDQGLRVYRRGDRFDVTLQTNILPDGFGFEIRGPPGHAWVFDAILCNRLVVLGAWGPIVCNNGMKSQNQYIEFTGMVGVWPRFEVTLKSPTTIDLRLGVYRLFEVMVQKDLPVGCAPADCVIIDFHWLTFLYEPPFYVILNPWENSGDDHVTGLVNADLEDPDFGYVLGKRGRRFESEAAFEDFTLNPTHGVVFEYAISAVDSLGTASASEAVGVVTQKVGNIPGLWLEGGREWPADVKFNRGENVPSVIEDIAARVNFCGQCMTFSMVLASVTRSIGAPDRPVTAMHPGKPGERIYNFHMWDEVWLNEVVSGNWSGHDATPGYRITPTGRTNLEERIPPGYAFEDGTPAMTTIYAGAADGSAENVTGAYGDPPVEANSEFIDIEPREPVFAYGDDLVADIVVRNPLSIGTTTYLNVSVSPEFIDNMYRTAVASIFSQNQTITIPASSEFRVNVVIPRSDYLVNGRFLARAFAGLGAFTEVSWSSLNVRGGIRLGMDAPTSITPGVEASILVTVENLLTSTLEDVEVELQIPSHLEPSSTNRTIDSLAGRQRIEFAVSVTPTDSIPEQIGGYVLSAEAGLSHQRIALGRQHEGVVERSSLFDRADIHQFGRLPAAAPLRADDFADLDPLRAESFAERPRVGAALIA